MGSPSVYIPQDRRQAMARGEDLPDRTQGAALFADISGFTPLTEILVKELGSRRGADELTKHLNLVYSALIARAQHYGGSVIGFSGDAITCWFDHDEGLRAIACGLDMQQAMTQFERITTSSGNVISLGMKVAIAGGPARRFRVGDPQIQYIDVLAGQTLERMAAAEHQAQRGEVLVSSETVALLNQAITVAEWRSETETLGTGRFAVVTGLTLSPQIPIGPSASFTAEEHLSEDQVRPWLLPPIFERLHDGQDDFLAEIRPAVALFLKFGGINYDQEDDAGKKLDRYIQWAQRTLARYEGYLIQLTVGDKGSYFYAVYGAPVAHDDDPARAVAVALELRSPPVELDFIGPVQIGLSQGRMRTGAYGSPSRQTYGVLGDETNMAARLMNKAEPGQILISQRVAEAVAKSYQLQYLGPVNVKGRAEPLLVSLVLERRLPSPQRPATLFTQPLVGRETELAQLDKNLAAVLLGEGHIVRLEGTAGVGKSHLSAEFVERALRLGFRVSLGACQSTSQNMAYYPWRQIFRTLFKLTDEQAGHQIEAATQLNSSPLAQVESMIQNLNPDWLLRLPLLGDLLGFPIPDNPTTAAFDPQLRQEALFTLVLEMIQKWAKEQPLLLLFEDAHWLDEASWRLVLALSRVIAHTPRVLLVLVHRPAPPGNQTRPFFSGLEQLPSYDLLNLNELSPAGITALVANRLQGQPVPLAASLIQLYAQGNPFYTEELVDTLRETGKLYRRPDGQWNLSETMLQALRQANALVKKEEQWVLAPEANLSTIDLGIPDSIHGLVLSRLDRLPELHKLTLKVASVIGRVFEFEALTLAHPLQPDQAALLAQIQGVEGRDFVRLEAPHPQLSYLFKHNITQEVVYQTLLDHQQRELHLAVGQALEQLQPEAVERLAYHYRQSGLQAKALFYLDKAAKKAQREYANETALNYYQQAIALEERWEWRKSQIEILHILGRRKEEQAELQRITAIPAAPSFEVFYVWGQYYEAVGEYAQAQAAVERALVASRQQANLLDEARCLSQLGLIASRQGDYQDAIVSYQHALNLFQNQGTYSEEQRRVLAQTLNGLGFVYREQGNFDQAKDSHIQALKLSEQNGDRQREAEALNFLGVLARYQRQLAASHLYLRQALTIRQAIGDRAGEGASLTNLADVTREMGDYSQAQDYYMTALAILQAAGHRWQEINVWISLGILYQELGELSKAQTSLHTGLEVARQIGDEAGQNYLESNLGLVLRDQGELVAAEQLFSRRLKLYEAEQNEYEMSFYLSYLSTVSLQAGQPQQAIAQAERALALRQKLGMHLNTSDDLAVLAKAQLMAGNRAKAVEYAWQSLAILDERGGEGPEFPARNYFFCYQVLTAVGEITAARVALQTAHKLVTARANQIADPILRQSFLERVAINQEIVATVQQQRPGD
ncbi:MAG: tetratricopeptide repeat protein [Anaerolineales bacterium]|nr:tetratricopeptide repeat protein [Anaerolineales bacterium]